MEGPFQLSSSVIDAVVGDPRPAVFLLRRIETTPAYAHYRGLVGRTQRGESLGSALARWVGPGYRVFWFEHADSDRDAFERECRLWHDLDGDAGTLDNDCHPRPDGISGGYCPLCTASARNGAA
ncbi:MAG: hypothetical protein OXJ90_18625 [Spirochaetaceae bacterium]|nr:hypothetical protein [Spirochaetaceae bacterium]